MENFLNLLNTGIADTLRFFVSIFSYTGYYHGRVFWIMVGMIIFDIIIKITFQLMGRNVH